MSMPQVNPSWSLAFELVSGGGFAIVVLTRIFLTLYYLESRPESPSPDFNRVQPFRIREKTVFLTEREARLIGPSLVYVAITFWALGLFAALLTRH
jgi:hypothetical protein